MPEAADWRIDQRSLSKRRPQAAARTAPSFSGEACCFLYGLQGFQVCDKHFEIFLSHPGITFVGHDGQDSAAIMLDAFNHGIANLLIGPITKTGFFVRCDVRAVDCAERNRKSATARVRSFFRDTVTGAAARELKNILAFGDKLLSQFGPGRY